MSDYLGINIETTDKSRWRLEVDHGKQTWHYLESNDEIKNWPQTACDRYWLGLSYDKINDNQKEYSSPKTSLEVAYNGYKFFKQLQTVDAVAIPSIGKFWLAMLNIYDWKGVNPSPLHPARVWGPIRATHLSMSYLYGRKIAEKMSPLIEQLRLELFVQPYDKIDWSAAKNNVCEADIYFHRSPILVVTNTFANICLGNDPENHESMIKALEFLEDSQIKNNPTYMKQCWRESSKGFWSFSTREQGWAANDCTAEALKAILLLQGKLDYTPPLINQKRIHSAIDNLIKKQHTNGGFSRYENIRGYCWMELINPSELLENTLIEHTYVECTSSVMTALRIFSKFDLVDHYVDDIE
ncbi:8309_t:CDS:2 [Racocetra fulgida]|uniref:8309_t:CDS:1 n=1 Tax=Racocetra fulgida TaxID=60492 RepID=A0A9N8WD71_9GLOM|nr:8309_t:CDS:2 [Racocetra fulgida]